MPTNMYRMTVVFEAGNDKQALEAYRACFETMSDHCLSSMRVVEIMDNANVRQIANVEIIDEKRT